MFKILSFFFLIFISSFSFAEEVLEKGLKNRPTRDFLFNMLSYYWDRSELPSERLTTIFDLFEKYGVEGELAMLLLHEKYPDMVDTTFLFTSHYRQARVHKFNAYASLMAPFVKEGVLLDFGAENLQLASALIRLNPKIQNAYATDIFPCQTPSNDSKLTFLVQDHPTKTTFAKESIDTILLSTVLHHIEPIPRRELLAHLYEILKPGGRVILVEDSFPAKSQGAHLNDNSLEKQFLSLSQEEKFDVLVFLDWWGNRMMKNRAEIPLPYTFKTEESWVGFFEDFGFVSLETQFLGFLPINTHMVSPKSLMIFEKPYSLEVSTLEEEPIFQRGEAIFEAHGVPPAKGVSIYVSVGGSKILVEGVNSQGEAIYRAPPFKWRDVLGDKQIGKSTRQWMLEQIGGEIQRGIQVCGREDIDQVIVSWAGPVVQGKVIGPNIAGFGFGDLSEQEFLSGGVNLWGLLKNELPKSVEVIILNDADDEALAEFHSKGIRDGTLLIIGTGIGAGFIIDGKVFFGPSEYVSRAGEIGHHLVFNSASCCYEYYGKETRGEVLSNIKNRVTDRLSGPALASRFLHFAYREIGKNVPCFLAYLNEKDSAFTEEEMILFYQEGRFPYSLEERVLKEITEKVKRGEERAIRFIRAVGVELGMALASFSAYFPDASFLKRIHLAGSVGYFFARGNEGEPDLFLESIKRGFVEGKKGIMKDEK